jgi:hypothetical protein
MGQTEERDEIVTVLSNRIAGAMMLKSVASGIVVRIPPKVRQDEEGRVVGVFGLGLDRLPQLSAQAIGTPDALNVEGVSSSVRAPSGQAAYRGFGNADFQHSFRTVGGTRDPATSPATHFAGALRPTAAQKPMNELLSGPRPDADLDPAGSLVVADMGSYYTYLN